MHHSVLLVIGGNWVQPPLDVEQEAENKFAYEQVRITNLSSKRISMLRILGLLVNYSYKTG